MGNFIPLSGCSGCEHYEKYDQGSLIDDSDPVGRCTADNSQFKYQEVYDPSFFCSVYSGEYKKCSNCVNFNIEMHEREDGSDCDSGKGPQYGIFIDNPSEFYCNFHISKV